MAIQNRTVTIKNVFAKNASTTIPNPPVIGTSYRNTSLTAAEVGKGWPFKEIVDSAKFNEAMYEYTTICKQLETYGFLPWCASTNYEIGSLCLGTDGNIYQAKRNTGPSTTARNPVNDTSHTYWDLFYYTTFTANRALVSNANGKVSSSNVTTTELEYLSGLTSNVQTQLNNKVNPSNAGTNAAPDWSRLITVSSANTVTSQGWIVWKASQNDTQFYISIDNNEVGRTRGSRGHWEDSCHVQILVAAGQTVRFYGGTCWFIPCIGG